MSALRTPPAGLQRGTICRPHMQLYRHETKGSTSPEDIALVASLVVGRQAGLQHAKRVFSLNSDSA